jgi:uncharacterized membrane protein YhaH (DUF805 family)
MNPASLYRDIPVAPCPAGTSADGMMEDLFEFLFNATGRINRAKYWRSLIVFGVAGLFAAVILFTAAGIAAPVFAAMLVVVLIPWLIWGFVIHTERLHDRDKSAWWLLAFYGLPALLGPVARMVSFPGSLGATLHAMLALAGFALSIWGLFEIGCLPGTDGSNSYGPDPRLQGKRASRLTRR